jgi:hypothetical protein
VRLYLDENLSHRVAEILRGRGIDATSAREIGNVGVDDRTQLRHATREGRAIVTADVADFVALAYEAIATNTSHPGIILVPPGFPLSAFAALADAIDEVARRYAAGAGGMVLFLDRRAS